LAGLRVGVWPDADAVRRLTQTTTPLMPRLDEAQRRQRLAEWHRAVRAVIEYYQEG
jgi:glycerol kinase